MAERFPDARVALLSSDLVPGLLEMRAIIHQIEAHEIEIIIGTQIVAKGHHFPDLAFVGVVDGDLGLAHGADPRAGERTFQLLHQVTGRAGRAASAGHGLVQTHMPEHPIMAAIVAGDRQAFLNYEIKTRQAGLLPPYGRLAAIIVSARDKELAERTARAVVQAAPPSNWGSRAVDIVRRRFEGAIDVDASDIRPPVFETDVKTDTQWTEVTLDCPFDGTPIEGYDLHISQPGGGATYWIDDISFQPQWR